MKYLFLFTLLMVGCAYPKRGEKYTPTSPPAGKAVVYVYRTPTSIDSANPDIPRFYINDKQLGKLAIGGYYMAEVDAGDLDIYFKDTLFGLPLPWTELHVKLKAEPKQKYFIKFSIESAFRIRELKQVSPAQGEAELPLTVQLIN